MLGITQPDAMVDTRYTSLVLHPCHERHLPIDLRGLAQLDCNGLLEGIFTLSGDLNLISWPSRRAAPEFRDSLWEHTCFEVFVAKDQEPGYTEYNFSPSGDWAAYRFNAYRNAGSGLLAENPCASSIVTHTSEFRLEWKIKLADHMRRETVWWLNLAAVIEDLDGTLYYWALAHPFAAPDFHHRTAFSLSVES